MGKIEVSIPNLITNRDSLLNEVIHNILPSSQNLFFLVGYFYFSGFEMLYRSLEDKNLNILVGMEIEVDIQNKVKEFYLAEKVERSRGSVRDSFYRSLVRLINDTDFFDSQEREEAFCLYLEKIKNGTLQIRKTKLPNHAKLYLFEHKDTHSENGMNPGKLITGSSNLSQSGLEDRYEANVILRDPRDYLEGKKLFDSLWKTAVDIANPDTWDLFDTQVIQKTWINNQAVIKPFWLYVRVLDELFTPKSRQRLKYPAEISNQGYFNLQYQTDAIDAAVSIIHRHGGVIISDVVGLGKSIVASVVAYNLGLKTLIIAPPHLKDQWEAYRWDFDFNARVYSSGSIHLALDENDPNEEMLIIIDEAHKYRNEATENYALLHRLCQGNKVILLTATPYSNKPQDIFSMIKLFQIPAKSTIQTVENLSHEFSRLIASYKKIERVRKSQEEPPEAIKQRIKSLALEIRNILSPLILRRTRLDLEAIPRYRDDLKTQEIVFPEVQDPIPLQYPLGDLTHLYLDTLEKISPEDENKGFIGARYKPVSYLKDFKKYRDKIAAEFGDEQLFRQAQINLAQFMRRLLVSRFESSVYAFQQTLNSLIDSLKNGHESVDPVFNNNIEQLKKKGYEFIPANELKKAFKQDVLKDIELLERIQDTWFPQREIIKDPKLEHFAMVVSGLLKKEPQMKKRSPCPCSVIRECF